MAKLTLLPAFLLTLCLAVAASSNSIYQNSSMIELVQSKGLKDCEKFLTISCRRVQMVTNAHSCRRWLRLCCSELEQIEVPRRCHEIKKMVKQQVRELRGRKKREMLQKAKNLPALCRMGIGRCDIRPFRSVLKF